MKTRIGFIGLGEMGRGMAKNLITKGFDLTVYDVRPEAINELKQLGAKSAGSPRELAAATEVVFSMVRDDAQTQGVMRGENGVLAGIGRGSAIIITSSVSPSLCKRLAEEAGKRGAGVIDSPVSGAKAGAEAGTLTLFVGGEQSVFRKVEPVLQAVAKNIFYLGGSGMGQVGKMANQIVLFCNMEGTTEGLAFAIKAGIPLERMLSLLKVSTGDNWIVQNWDKMDAWKRDHSPLATLHNMNKDLKLILEYAQEIGIEVPLISISDRVDLWKELPG